MLEGIRHFDGRRRQGLGAAGRGKCPSGSLWRAEGAVVLRERAGRRRDHGLIEGGPRRAAGGDAGGRGGRVGGEAREGVAERPATGWGFDGAVVALRQERGKGRDRGRVEGGGELVGRGKGRQLARTVTRGADEWGWGADLVVEGLDILETPQECVAVRSGLTGGERDESGERKQTGPGTRTYP